MTSDDTREESEFFFSALNASPESFVHKALKDKQIECIHRTVCHGGDVLAVLPTGLDKGAIYQLISKVLFPMGRTAKATSKTTAELSVLVGSQSGTVPPPSSASETYSLRTKQEDLFYKINHIFVSRNVQHCMYIHAFRALCNSRP